MLFRFLDWYRNYKLDKIRLDAEIKNKPYETIKDVVKLQQEMINKYFDSFKVTDLPTSSVVRSEDEYNDEQERERFGGLDRGIRESIKNAINSGALPELASIIGD